MVHGTKVEPFAERVPYTIANIELDGRDRLRFLAPLSGIAWEDVAVGMHVEVTFLEIDGAFLPFFRPVTATLAENRVPKADERGEIQ